MEKNELNTTIAEIRSAAQEVKSYVVESLPDSERETGYRVTLPLQEFLKLLGHVGPRILYFHASTFNARRDAVSGLLQGFDTNEDTQQEMLERPEVVGILKRYGEHEGEHDTLSASFVIDGILHSVFERASWFQEFQDEVVNLQAYYEQVQDEEDEQSQEVDKVKVREYATKLCAHPKFNEGRPSREKRTYLAENLFPELSEEEIFAVVEEATNLGWMTS